MLPSTTVSLRDTSGAAFAAAMKKAKHSTRSLAKIAGCSPARIAQLAAGEYTATALILATAIAAALDVDVKDLFEFPDGEALINLGLIRAI